MNIVGRLKPGVSVASAQAEFTVLAKQLENQHPDRNPVLPRLVPLQQHVSGQVRPALVVLMCAVGVVMLIVCANLSHLQMARMGAAAKGNGDPGSVGSGAISAAAAGAHRERHPLVLRRCAGPAPRRSRHPRPFASACVQPSSSCKAFESMEARLRSPCWRRSLRACCLAWRPRCRSRRQAPRRAARRWPRVECSRHGWFRDGLVVSQFALACMLLVGAALLLKSFMRVLDVDLGFQPMHAAALRIDPGFHIASLAQQNSFIDDVLHRARSIPGVTAAGISDVLPLDGDRGWQVSGKGQVYDKDHHPEAFIRVVSDGYFEALGIALKSGRAFTESDRASSEPVVIVNETLARDSVARAERGRTDGDAGRWTASGRSGCGCPSRGARNCWRLRNVSANASNRRLRGDEAGGANGSAAR